MRIARYTGRGSRLRQPKQGKACIQIGLHKIGAELLTGHSGLLSAYILSIWSRQIVRLAMETHIPLLMRFDDEVAQRPCGTREDKPRIAILRKVRGCRCLVDIPFD